MMYRLAKDTKYKSAFWKYETIIPEGTLCIPLAKKGAFDSQGFCIAQPWKNMSKEDVHHATTVGFVLAQILHPLQVVEE